MEIPHLGTVTQDHTFGWYYSLPMPVPVLGRIKCQIVLEGYIEIPTPEGVWQHIQLGTEPAFAVP